MSNPEDLIVRALELTDRHDWAGREALMTPDCEFVMAGVTLQGPAATTAYSKPMMAALPDATHHLDLVVSSGDVIVAEGTWTGTHTAPLATPNGEVLATGRTVRLSFAMVARVLDGRIASMRVYLDQLAFLGQLGLVPQPQAA